jgi:hypothetical protein
MGAGAPRWQCPPAEAAPPLLPAPAGPPPSMQVGQPRQQVGAARHPLGTRLRDASVPTPADRTTLAYCSTSLSPPRLLRSGVHPPTLPMGPPPPHRAEGWGGPRCLCHPLKQLPRCSQNMPPLPPNMRQQGRPAAPGAPPCRRNSEKEPRAPGSRNSMAPIPDNNIRLSD